MRIAILVMAAGSSSRMGSIKQLLAFGESTILGTVIKNLSNIPNTDAFCVLGHEAEQIAKEIDNHPIEIIINEDYKNGLSSSIASGIEHIESFKEEYFQGCLVVLGDQPLIEKSYFEKILQSIDKESPQIIATTYEEKVGVPAFFPATYFEELKKLQGDKGASTFLNNMDNILLLRATDLSDIDTVSEYIRISNSKKVNNDA